LFGPCWYVNIAVPFALCHACRTGPAATTTAARSGFTLQRPLDYLLQPTTFTWTVYTFTGSCLHCSRTGIPQPLPTPAFVPTRFHASSFLLGSACHTNHPAVLHATILFWFALLCYLPTTHSFFAYTPYAHPRYPAASPPHYTTCSNTAVYHLLFFPFQVLSMLTHATFWNSHAFHRCMMPLPTTRTPLSLPGTSTVNTSTPGFWLPPTFFPQVLPRRHYHCQSFMPWHHASQKTNIALTLSKQLLHATFLPPAHMHPSFTQNPLPTPTRPSAPFTSLAYHTSTFSFWVLACRSLAATVTGITNNVATLARQALSRYLR